MNVRLERLSVMPTQSVQTVKALTTVFVNLDLQGMGQLVQTLMNAFLGHLIAMLMRIAATHKARTPAHANLVTPETERTVLMWMSVNEM